MRAAFGATVSELHDADDGVAVVLAEISTDYFVDAMPRHPTRVVNIGIMEQAMVGVAAGFAMEGFHPIAHSLSPFMAERPYEQLKLDFGYRGSAAYSSAWRSRLRMEGTHHAPADATLDARDPADGGAGPGHGDRSLH
jgi:transketolase